MRKLYLFIMAALLLIGSGTLWAASYTYNDVTYTEESKLWEAVGDVASITVKIGEYSNLTIPESKTVTLQQVANNQTNGEITNNGTLNLSYGTTSNNTWSSGTFVNNATLTLKSGSTWENASFINNGTLTISGGTLHNASFTNTGTITPLTAGTFNSELLETLEGLGATIAEGYESNTYYADITCKQILKSSSIVARITTLEGNVFAFNGITLAMRYSTKETPAVLQKNLKTDGATNDIKVIDGNDRYIDPNGFTLTINNKNTKITHGSLNFVGNGTIAVTSDVIESAFFLTGSETPTTKPYASLTIGEGITLNCSGEKASAVCVRPFESTGKSYGVVADIKGTINIAKSYALYIHGTIQAIEGNVPEINIANGATIETACDGDAACIYAAGYGKWNIGAATLRAATPIYAKSGIININGASVEACGAFAEPKPHGSGYYGTGDAIVLDSKSGYAGNMQLNVTDATISSANGYSVQEVLTDSPESSTIAMQITGGKYKGARGTIVTSKHFGESTPTHWAMNAIEGGKYAYAPSTIADGYKVVFNTDADKNEYPYTIVVDDLAPASTIEIAENTIVDEVVNVAENTGIVVKSGVTYTVKGLVIGTGEESKSKVTVEPGAKLIVGSNGILNYANNQLVLQADKDNGCAILRFEGTTGNAQPYGKVELYMYAHKEDGLNVWQHIGIPTAEAPVEIAKTAPYMFNIWDLNKGWQYAPQSEVKDPWTGYNSSTNMESAGSKLTFVGQLVGNAAAEYVLAPNNYSCIANSYTDYVGIKGFINQLPASKTDGTVWVYGLSNNGKAGFTLYNESSFDLKPDPGFSPMQAFFIKNVTEDEIQLNIPYGEMGTTKDADASEVNGGVIVLTGGGERAELQIIEKEGLSDGIIDPKYDSEQFDTDMIKIYTEKCGKNLAAIGTNSLEGKEITIVTKAATSYTLSFEYLAGKAFKLTDLASGAEVEVGADKTYTFTAEVNSTIKRFKLGEGEVAANETDADGAVSIWTNNGQVFVANNAAEADIEIINLSGVKVASAKASGEAVQDVSISNLASGVYVVRVGNTAAKIVK
ncbi:MAG: T9SS type A sorting domain-containing protein [Paludibacteraceae bacterium]|nr:T9SS type A sorting domain-containing protein [Paludibacteraceae bacterium]MBQ6765718.1 T9SS type A sorting domain-containing protein [Paludibacteraceae bacterium]